MNSDFEGFEFGADVLSALNSAEKGESLTKTIDYTRPLAEYASPQQIADFILTNKKTKHVYTKDLRVNGAVVQDTFEKYLGAKHYGSSTIKEILKTPLHFSFAIDGDKKALEKLEDKKNHFEMGTFAHQAILEPTKFDRVIVEPKSSLSSTEGVNELINFWTKVINDQGYGIDHEGKQITPEEAFDMASSDVVKLNLSMDKIDGKKVYFRSLAVLSGKEAIGETNFLKIQILRKHYERYGGGLLPRLLKHSKREISFYHTDPETGIDVKVRPDALQFEENIGCNAIISIKSSACEDLRAFMANSAKLHYDLSEGMYQEVCSEVTGRDFNCTITIFLQTVAPFAIAVLVWKPEDIEMGKYKYRTALRDIQKCAELGVYPGYDSLAEENTFGLVQMSLPNWNNVELAPKSIEN
ncbi:hypothetical protein ATE49_15435 [Elizabethkingia miricola]|nr:hypothetical protein ATE49_15435 [Elizabethkingia miricola]